MTEESSKREEARRLLLHYFNLAARSDDSISSRNEHFHGDGASEIYAIVDCIVDAAVDEAVQQLKPNVLAAAERLMVEIDKRDEVLDRLIRAVGKLES